MFDPTPERSPEPRPDRHALTPERAALSLNRRAFWNRTGLLLFAAWLSLASLAGSFRAAQNTATLSTIGAWCGTLSVASFLGAVLAGVIASRISRTLNLSRNRPDPLAVRTGDFVRDLRAVVDSGGLTLTLPGGYREHLRQKSLLGLMMVALLSIGVFMAVTGGVAVAIFVLFGASIAAYGVLMPTPLAMELRHDGASAAWRARMRVVRFGLFPQSTEMNEVTGLRIARSSVLAEGASGERLAILTLSDDDWDVWQLARIAETARDLGLPVETEPEA